jgi:hypothetical protein
LVLDGQSVPPFGSREVAPLTSTTYTLTAQGQTGPATAQVTVEVVAMSTGLLPDRGGFVCGIGRPGQRAGITGLALIGLLAALLGRRRPHG